MGVEGGRAGRLRRGRPRCFYRCVNLGISQDFLSFLYCASGSCTRMGVAAGSCVLFSLVAALGFRFGHLIGVVASLVAVPACARAMVVVLSLAMKSARPRARRRQLCAPVEWSMARRTAAAISCAVNGFWMKWSPRGIDPPSVTLASE